MKPANILLASRDVQLSVCIKEHLDLLVNIQNLMHLGLEFRITVLQ